MSQSEASRAATRTIRASDEQVESVLESLDREQTPPEIASERSSTRHTFRLSECLLEMCQPGAAEFTTFLVKTRNISAGGIALLHGGFVHVGTRCRLRLMTTDKVRADVSGRVVRCRYLGQGTLHEIGVQFDSPIEPSAFASSAVQTRILLAEDDAILARLTIAQLQPLNAQVDHVLTGRAAVEKALESEYDAILMDIEMPELDGIAATRQLREAGYSGKIVALTARDKPDDRRRCLAAGCDRHLAKPYTPRDLEWLLESLRRDALTTTLEDEDLLRDLAAVFVEELPEKIERLQAARGHKDLERLESFARLISAEGGTYGFQQISDCATRLEQAVGGRKPPVEIKRLTDELVGWCQRELLTATKS